MSRDIKFRVWNGEDFYYSGFLISSAGRVHGVSRWDMFDEAHTFSYESFSKTAILQQFTGLLDKNNKEIYEGDIIGSHASEKPCNYIVKWGETRSDYCGFVLNPVFINPPKFTHIIHNFKMWMAEDFEVLGNIFQNPELLA